VAAGVAELTLSDSQGGEVPNQALQATAGQLGILLGNQSRVWPAAPERDALCVCDVKALKYMKQISRYK
jgi:hypothetical protein